VDHAYTRASDLELDGFVEELGRRQVEAEEEGFVPERRVGRVLDARLRGLLVTLHATDRADVGAGQLTGLDDLHPKLHGNRHIPISHAFSYLFIYLFICSGVAFSASTLSVVRQQEHSACKNLGDDVLVWLPV